MAHPNATIRTSELDLIRSDAEFQFGIVSSIHASKQSGIVMPAYIPHIARFIIESYAWFETVSPEFAREVKLNHEPLIRSMRRKTKLLEERDIIARLSDIVDRQKAIFIESHTGPLAWLKKEMQPDLGLYFYQRHLISTTYTMYLYLVGDNNVGQTSGSDDLKQLGLLGHSVGIEIGAYLGGLVSVFRGESVQLPPSVGSPIDDFIDWEDVKSREYLSTAFNGKASPEINTSLLILISFFNFVHYVIRSLHPGKSEALFRLKYLTLYHLRASLQQLQNKYYQTGLFTDKSRRTLATILKDKDLKTLLSQSKFRNAITHYTLSQLRIGNDELDSYASFPAVVERTFSARSVDALDAEIDEHMNKIAAHLEEWLSNHPNVLTPQK